jgi:hypothetical protein
MNTTKLLKIFSITFVLFTFFSCELNDDDDFPDPDYIPPTLNIVDGTTLELGVGQLLNYPGIEILGSVGITELTISENGNQLFGQTYDGTSGNVTASFQFEIPEAWFDTTRDIIFTATDTRGNSNTVTVSLIVSEILPQYEIEDVTINGQDFRRITGTINFDETLDNNSLWLISGAIRVFQQTTLTIEEGTQIFAETIDTRIDVDPLGIVDWQGTATNPIVFNSLANAPGQGAGDTSRGQWSGIDINGVGGEDNSGIVRYVRLMYPGSDNDAIQFTNAGSGTTAEYIQVYRSGDNSIRVNEGTINLKYLVSTDPTETRAGIRWDDGWIGNGQFWVVTMLNGSDAIQGRSGSGFLSNVTITGSALNDSSLNPVGRGFFIRDGGTAKIYNSVITGLDVSIRFRGESIQSVSNGQSFISNSASFNNLEDDGTGFHSTTDFFNPTDNDYIPSFNNSVTPFAIVESIVGTDTSNSTAAGALNPFFEDVNFVGAIPADNDWTLGWCVNLDGSIRN